MKAYERVNVEVVKFEAQDVITASVAECTCNQTRDAASHYGTWNQGIVDHTNRDFGAEPCYADEHPNCVKPADIN